MQNKRAVSDCKLDEGGDNGGSVEKSISIGVDPQKNQGDDDLLCLKDHSSLAAEASQQSIGNTSNADSVEEIEKDSEKYTRPISDDNYPPVNFNIDLNKDVTPVLADALLIGRGGYAYVYKSFYFNFPIAIKLLIDQFSLNAEQKDAFKHELSILSKLNHKNIVKFYGASLQPGNRAFIMEYLESNLFQMMEKQRRSNARDNTIRRFSISNIFKIIKAIASGLNYLHSKKIVHRDLHPENVLISKDGNVKVADMGISKILQHSTLVNTKKSGMFAYLAPEIFRGIINCKSDIYSLGIIAWELWSLDESWKKFGEGLLCKKIQNGERPNIPDDMPQNLRELIKNCWQQDYKKRPSALEVEQECEIEIAELDIQKDSKN